MPRPPAPEPYWATTDGELVRLYRGDVIVVLRRLPSYSVQMVVTSPPYWGLRDYGTDKTLEIGSEKTPEEYVAKLVAVFREVRRVLRDDGTVWLNMGDSYASGGRCTYRSGMSANKGHEVQNDLSRPDCRLKGGNLVFMPARAALALQADGWILRQDIIWHKPSPMPESVRNRCTKAHEYLFLLAKSARYYYDAEAIKERAKNWGARDRTKGKYTSGKPPITGDRHHGLTEADNGATGRNRRSVWTIASQAYEGAHFATFPKKLVEPCILAGTSEKGCCGLCGAPWERIVENKGPVGGHQFSRRDGNYHEGNTGLANQAGAHWNICTLGWEPTCVCGTSLVRQCVVLDPFIGSGTTAVVAVALGRRCWGIDLSEAYLQKNAIPRIEGILLDRPRLAVLAGKPVQRVVVGTELIT